MKLFRYGSKDKEKPGAIDLEGNLRDLSLLVPDLTPDWLSPEKLRVLTAVDLQRMPLLDKNIRLGVPFVGTRQFVAVGLNYKKHAEESGHAIPMDPVVFFKSISCLSGANDAVVLPKESTSTDWEIELGVVIGRTAYGVSVNEAMSYVAGYCLANDISERDWQLKRSGQWGKGKSFPGFGPIGPWLVTTDELPDPQNIQLELNVNGVMKQSSSTSDMIFSVKEIVSHVSQFMTLLPGDLIITGTPSGVGLGMKPPEFVKRGDIMTLYGGVLGYQRQLVI